MYKVDAFTSEFGTKYRYTYAYRKRSGVRGLDGQWVPYNDWKLEGSVADAYSRRNPPVKGDGVGDFPYSRQAGRVVTNTPKLVRHNWENPWDTYTSAYDYVEETLISPDHNPFSYNPINWDVAENARIESKVKALNKLKATSAELAVTLLQSRQSVDLFASAVRDAANFLRSIRKGRPLGWYRSRDFSRHWLEYAYGWKPLAQDLYDTYTATQELMSGERKLSVSGKGAITGSGEFPYRTNLQSYDWEVSVVTQVRARIVNSEARFLNGVGFLNPASIAWELVPWSFVLDWFIPIGQTLEAFSATSGLEFVGGCVSRQASYRLIIKERADAYPSGSNTTLISPGEYVEEWFSFDRDHLRDFPLPSLYADVTPLSLPRVGNALALLAQLR